MVTNTMFSAVIAERDALQTALATERSIWLTAASEQGRVIEQLRENLRELFEAALRFIDAADAYASSEGESAVANEADAANIALRAAVARLAPNEAQS